MSYCRFHNTYLDLCDCVGALESYGTDEEEISANEKLYAQRLYETCREYIEAYEETDLGE